MAGRGGRSHRRSRIERAACASESCLDAGGVGAPLGHFEVGARGTIPSLGRHLTDAVPDAVAHVARRESPVPQQCAARAHCRGCRLPDRYVFQPRISARVRRAAGSLAAAPISSRPCTLSPAAGMNIRDAKLSEIGQLAKIWFDGWQDAHAQIVPAELARHRTLESFGERLRALIAGVRVVGPADAPVGFYMLKGDELYQFYVSSRARGTGVAAALMADAEIRLGESGA